MSTDSTTVLAHGIGGRQDLPISFTLVLVGAVTALVVSFGALGWLWRESRLRGEAAGRPLPRAVQRFVDGAPARWVLRLLGLLLTGFVAVAAFFGPDRATNPAATWVYVVFWIGLVFASVLFGPVWRQLNPLRTIHLGIAGLLGTRPEVGLLPLPRRLGYWPAAASLFSFTWLELVAPDRATTPVIRLYFVVYLVVHLMAATLYGARWFDRGDGFEAYSSLVGKLSPFGRRADGRLVLRNPLDGLDTIQPAPGLVTTVCVLLGSTAYDGFSSSTTWVRVMTTTSSPELLATLGLAGFVLATVLTYSIATWLAGTLGDATGSGERLPGTAGAGLRGMPGAFIHSLVPIAVGYVIAHYFSLFVFEGQNALILASDPLVNGANLLGLTGRRIDYSVVSASTIALVQVLAIVVGHVVGVFSAHDRAVRLFPRRQAVAGQLPLLVLMICYTLGGLLLLFSS